MKLNGYPLALVLTMLVCACRPVPMEPEQGVEITPMGPFSFQVMKATWPADFRLEGPNAELLPSGVIHVERGSDVVVFEAQNWQNGRCRTSKTLSPGTVAAWLAKLEAVQLCRFRQRDGRQILCSSLYDLAAVGRDPRDRVEYRQYCSGDGISPCDSEIGMKLGTELAGTLDGDEDIVCEPAI